MLTVKPLGANKRIISVILLGLFCATIATNSSSGGVPELVTNASYPWQLELKGADGKTTKLSDYRGQTLLLSFFYTTCGYACPVQTARLAQVQKLLKDETLSASRFVSVSVHPSRDTPQRIDAFKRPYDVNQTHWQFGSPTDSNDLAQVLLQAGVSTREMTESDQTDHTMKILLIDPAGKVMQRYVGDKFNIKRVAKEVDTLVRLRSRS